MLLPTTAGSSASVGQRRRRVAFIWPSPGAGRDTAGPGSRAARPNEADLPRRLHSVARLTMRGSTVAMPGTSNRTPMSASGSAIMEFDDHEDHEKNWNDTDDCAC